MQIATRGRIGNGYWIMLVGAGRHPRSGQGVFPAPATLSFFPALPKGNPLWKPRAGVAIEYRSGVFAAGRAWLRAKNIFSKTATDGIIEDAVL